MRPGRRRGPPTAPVHEIRMHEPRRMTMGTVPILDLELVHICAPHRHPQHRVMAKKLLQELCCMGRLSLGRKKANCQLEEDLNNRIGVKTQRRNRTKNPSPSPVLPTISISLRDVDFASPRKPPGMNTCLLTLFQAFLALPLPPPPLPPPSAHCFSTIGLMKISTSGDSILALLSPAVSGSKFTGLSAVGVKLFTDNNLRNPDEFAFTTSSRRARFRLMK